MYQLEKTEEVNIVFYPGIFYIEGRNKSSAFGKSNESKLNYVLGSILDQ